MSERFRRRIPAVAVSTGFFFVVLTAALVLAASVPDSASDLLSRPLTREAAVEYALSHNRLVKSAKQDVNASGEKVKESRADFFPKIDSAYSFTQLQNQPYAMFDTLKAFTGYNSTNRWDFEMRQPLFTGFNLTAQLNISKMDLKISEYRYQEVRLNVIQEVQRAFWRVILGEKLLKVASDNVKSLEVQRRNAEANYKQGVAAQNDVLKADVALSHAKLQERTAAKQVVIFHANLNQLLDLGSETRLTLSEGVVQPGGLPDLDALYVLAEQQRPEILAIKTAIRQADEGVRAAKSRYYPHVSAFAEYYREGEGFFVDKNAYYNMDNAAVGLRVDLNLFEGGKTNAAIKEWQYRKVSLEERYRNLKQQVQVQVEDAFEQLKVARANIETAHSALKQAEENERMTTIQYKEQMVIFLEVLNAQVFVSQTQVDYYDALYGYQIAKADLERATGGPVAEPGG